MTLTESQMHDLAGRLTRLRFITADHRKAIADEREASRRSADAQRRYVAEWTELVSLYGEQNAPKWLEKLDGPKPSAEVTK